MGGLFVNYFNDFGRTWQAYIEAEAPYRANTQDLSQFYVRNNQGRRTYRFPRSRTSRAITARNSPCATTEYRSAHDLR